MSSACVSSGVLTTDSLVSAKRVKLVSVHCSCSTGGTATIKVYDSGTATAVGKVEVARMIVGAGTSNEFDMHGRVMAEGIYVDITGTGSYSIEFA